MVEDMKNYSIESDLSKVRELAAVFQQFSKEEKLADDLSGQLELILVEAVNNVIEHAYENKSGLPIEARFEACDSEVVITIKDQGLPVPKVIQESEKEMPDIFALPEGGWGLGLIYALTDQVKHYTQDGMNVMELKKGR